jgi:hypothetical protein
MNHESVLVPADVENDPISFNEAGVPVFSLDIFRAGPRSM